MHCSERGAAFRVVGALLGAALLTLATPADAFHFPWDQGHDTTSSNDPPPPGPDPRPSCDPCNGSSTASPVYAALGHAIWSNTDVMLRGRPVMGIQRVYNSNDPVVGPFGNGWTVDFDVALYPANSSGVQQRVFKADNGKRFVYVKQADGSFLAPAGRFETLVEGPSSVTMTYLDGRRSVFAPDGRLLEQFDAAGNRVGFGYDSALRPNRIDDGNGRSLVIAYNASGLVSSVTDHSGRAWGYAYDANGNLVAVTNPGAGQLSYAWQAYRPPGDANTYWQLLSVTDPSGVVQVSFTYSGNQVASYTEGANRYTYTRTGSNTSLAGTVTRRDSLGVSTSFSYGALGLVTQKVNGLGGRTTYTYDANGRLATATDPLNRVWTTSYDAAGRMVASIDPLGRRTALAYDGNSFRAGTVTTPSGRVIAMSYDARGGLVTTTDPTGAVKRIDYNAAGDAVGVTDAMTRRTTIAYNATGLPTQVTDPLGRVRQSSYDALGRTVAVTNAAGETTRYAYDALDRVTAMTDGLGRVTSFGYDAAGRLTSLVDAKGSTTQYQYDAFGRRVLMIAPDGSRTSYAWRLDNLLQTVTWPDNTTISYSYDANKRLTGISAGGETISYGYDAAGQLVTANGPGGTLAYGYDAAGRVASETADGRTVAITRNTEGERTALTVLGTTQTYTRDARGAVTRIASPAGNFDFSYDPLGRRTQLSYPDGATARYAFDEAGQLSSLTHAGAFAATYTHGFDAAGRVVQISGDGPDWQYSYDAAGRLTRATNGASSFDYPLDEVGNVVGPGRSYDLNHRLTADASRDYSYDARGNLVRETERSTGARSVYTWNLRNQLTRLEFFADAAATTPLRTLSFTYDPLGRRSSKTDAGVVRRYLYDGDDLVGVVDAAGNPVAVHVFGGAVDEPLAVVAGGSTRLLHGNHMGSVMAAVEGGAVTSYRYGPYGEDLSAGAAELTPFRYTGREKDTDALYYYRARYYSTGSGRFVQRDPIGLAGGPNPYAYGGASPTTGVDPTGLDVLVIAGGRRPDSWNIAGHIAIGFPCGGGMYSFGNDTALGSDIGTYLQGQIDTGRDNYVIRIPTTPEQEQKMLDYLKQFTDPNGIEKYPDNCAHRTREALKSGGLELHDPIFWGLTGEPGNVPMSVARAAADQAGATTTLLPPGSSTGSVNLGCK